MKKHINLTVLFLLLLSIKSNLNAQDTIAFKNYKKEIFLNGFKPNKHDLILKIQDSNFINYKIFKPWNSSYLFNWSIKANIKDSFRIFIHVNHNILLNKFDTTLSRTACFTCNKIGDGIDYEYFGKKSMGDEVDSLFSILYLEKDIINFSTFWNPNGVSWNKHRLKRYLKKNKKILNITYKEAVIFLLDKNTSFLDCVKYFKVLEIFGIKENSFPLLNIHKN